MPQITRAKRAAWVVVFLAAANLASGLLAVELRYPSLWGSAQVFSEYAYPLPFPEVKQTNRGGRPQEAERTLAQDQPSSFQDTCPLRAPLPHRPAALELPEDPLSRHREDPRPRAGDVRARQPQRPLLRADATKGHARVVIDRRRPTPQQAPNRGDATGLQPQRARLTKHSTAACADLPYRTPARHSVDRSVLEPNAGLETSTSPQAEERWAPGFPQPGSLARVLTRWGRCRPGRPESSTRGWLPPP